MKPGVVRMTSVGRGWGDRLFLRNLYRKVDGLRRPILGKFFAGAVGAFDFQFAEEDGGRNDRARQCAAPVLSKS